MSTLREVIQVLRAVQPALADAEVLPDHRLRDDLGIESIKLVEIVVRLEEQYQVEFLDMLEVKRASTLGALVDLVQRKQVVAG